MKYFIRYILVFLLLLCNSLLIGQQDYIFDNEYKNKLLYSISNLVETKYVIPEVALKSTEEFNQKVSSGFYDSITDTKQFTQKVTKDLIDILGDKHINFRMIGSEIEEKPKSSLHHPIRYHKLGLKENFGFSRLEILEGNIGFIELRRFYKHSDIKDIILNSMKFLSHSDAIIIDIRQNGGGSGDYLSSYFLDYPTQLNSNYSREDNYTTEYWTTDDIGMKPMTDIPIFILTSDKTFSAAESFAYDMKVRNRAILIGDSTKGGAHSVDLYNLYEQFEIYIPTMRAINPVTGENWEGIGVIPDVTIDASIALDTALVIAKKSAEKYAKVKEEKLKNVIAEMQSYLENAELYVSEDKINLAYNSLDSLLHIAQENDIVNTFFFHVWSYHYSSINDEKMLYVILNKFLEYYPESIMPYEKFIYAYNKFGKRELTLDYINQTLLIDPNNQYAIQMKNRLKN